MRNAQSGFSLLEVMAAVATVGVLSAVVIPSFIQSKPKAQTADAQAELSKIEAAARNYYLAEGKFPGSTVTALPGPNGGACHNSGKKFPVSSLWSSDPVWQSLDFHVDQASGWTYHFETTGAATARIRAVGDPDCDGVLTTIQVDMHADVAMDEENDGSDDSGQMAHNWAPQSAQQAGVYPGSISTVSTAGGTPTNTTTNLGGTTTTSGADSTTPGAPSAGTIASTSTGSTAGSTTNTISSTTTTSGTPCNWGNGQGAGQGCLNGVANGDTNNTNNDAGHPGMTGGTNNGNSGNGNTTTTTTSTNNGNGGTGNSNGNGKK